MSSDNSSVHWRYDNTQTNKLNNYFILLFAVTPYICMTCISLQYGRLVTRPCAHSVVQILNYSAHSATKEHHSAHITCLPRRIGLLLELQPLLDGVQVLEASNLYQILYRGLHLRKEKLVKGMCLPLVSSTTPGIKYWLAYS